MEGFVWMAWRFYFGNLLPLNISINQSPWSWNQAYLHLCRLDRVVITLPMIPVHPVSKCLVLAPGFSGELRFISCIWSVFWNLTLGKAHWGWSCGRHCTTTPLWICTNRDYWNIILSQEPSLWQALYGSARNKIIFLTHTSKKRTNWRSLPFGPKKIGGKSA